MITAKLIIAQPIKVNASGISTRGARGKSTYELYLETTTDNPPMTEEEFVNSKAVLEQTTGQSITHGMSQKAVTDQLALKVDKVTGKSLISDTEITRLASVTNQTLSGLGGEPALNKKITINPASDIEFPTSKAVATALALKTDDATLQASLKAAYPVVPYRSRVLADSGVISDQEKLTKLYVDNLKLLDNTVFLWDGSAGIKTRTSGANTYATKLYDMSAGNRDAVQATEANQPFVGGGIAPSERIRLKNNSLVKALSHSTINISSVGTNGFSITTVLKPTFNKLGTAANQGRYVMGSVELYFNNTGALILYSPGTGALSVGNNLTNLLRRGSSIVTWVADAYGFRCYVNGVQYAITGTYTPFSGTITGMLNTGSDAAFDGEIYHHQIFNKALSASEVQAQHAYLRLQHPEIEGINIGNQHWATSNCVLGATGNGTVIPEVQGASTAANSEIWSGGDFENGLFGSILNEIGGAVVSYELNEINPISGTRDGLISITNAGSNNGRPLLRTQDSYLSVKGKEYIIEFDYKVVSGEVVIYRVGLGGHSILLVDETLVGTGHFSKSFVANESANSYGAINFNGTKVGSVQIDNVSIKEVGWADLTTPAWCYYDNNPLNGAVYGKLYNWYAVQAIASNPPAGWRVPTVADFTQLTNYLGGTAIAGGKLKKEGAIYWSAANIGATNESGFSAIGAGWRFNTDGTFTVIGQQNRIWTSTSGGMAWLNFSDAALQIAPIGQDLKRGYSLRLIRNEPVGATERNIETGYITNALGATNLDISIPFGYQVESVRIDSETNITGLSAKLLTGGLTELETLFTAKSVTANVQKVIAADADQSIQQTDAVVRINGTKADTTKRFRVWIKLTKVVFS